MIGTRTKWIERTTSRISVDSVGGWLRGVKLLGPVSKNGRRYTAEAMRNAVGLYDGTKCFLNHPKRNELEEDRPFESWVGVVRNPRVDAGGIFGDIELRTKGPHYNQIIEAAERFADHFGCSHVADGKSRLDNGEEVIESITHVFSVDLVCEPATTKGLAESTNGAAISTDPILQAIDHYLGADGDRETLVAFLKDILETMVEKADQIADGKAGTAHLPPSAESFAAFWPKPISREESERFAQSLR